LLTLIVIPAIFGLVKGYRLPNGGSDQSATPSAPVKRVTQHIPEPAK
jgi:Cu(I)/Ag(I) efflux system membrane protein CusA/SilA